MNIPDHNSESLETFFGLNKILKFFDPGSGNLFNPGSGIRDRKHSDPGSGIKIPDPQHCSTRTNYYSYSGLILWSSQECADSCVAVQAGWQAVQPPYYRGQHLQPQPRVRDYWDNLRYGTLLSRYTSSNVVDPRSGRIRKFLGLVK